MSNPTVGRLENPEALARHILSQTQQASPPTDLERVVISLGGIEVREERIDADGYLLEFGPESAEILIRSDANPHRQRFTLAHELGHVMLSRRLIGTCRNISPRNIERWCDQFAASLLMPAKWITQLVGSFDELSKSNTLVCGNFQLDVSRNAFYRRINELFGVSVLEIKADDWLEIWPPSVNSKAAHEILARFARTRLWSEFNRLRSTLTYDNRPRLVGPYRADSTDLRTLKFAPNTRWVFAILWRRASADQGKLD